MNLSGSDSLWTCQMHPVGASMTYLWCERGQTSCGAWVWRVVWSQVMKLGPSSSWQKPFCLMCFFRVELTSCYTNQGILRPGKLRLQFVWLCPAHPWSRDPLASGFCYPSCPICSLPPFYLPSPHHVWCTLFLKASLPYPEPSSVCLLNASKA